MYDWVRWFIYDQKKLIRQTRKIGRTKSYLVLRPEQRENLAQTMQDVIDELERIKKLCKKGGKKK